ncbi:unnamed protein product [Rangifer tarandus platyrhynchus]|uniref:Uncharacterized protein n=1 Tax=Rangifer tarandus platyrhynchus TaxID=3082113 RepID=A0ABN8XPN8_RANTA|nr:unnamed protein product [Rangifer tarandus platyrhynchus]CAI9149552.1 unnamed protein product [Rangifer tarandus platyrhynchus]
MCWGPRQGAGLRLLRGSGSSGASRTQRWEYPRLLLARGTRQDGGGGGGDGDDYFLVLLDLDEKLNYGPEDIAQDSSECGRKIFKKASFSTVYPLGNFVTYQSSHPSNTQC